MTILALWLAVVAFPVAAHAAETAAPAQIILIRHAEKPEVGNDLSPRGLERAQALVGFFETDPEMAKFGPPAAIYAMQPKPSGKESRPLETVQPLAASLGLTVNTSFKKDDVAGLAASALSDPAAAGKTVVIAWEHHVIPAIARALGAAQAPETWAGEAFDRAWVLDFDGGKVISFRDLPQRLLPGDSSN